MLTRIKTLPLPTVARRPRSTAITTVRKTAAIPEGPIAVIGETAEAEHARAVVHALGGVAMDARPLVLASIDAIPSDGTPYWLLARANAVVASQPGMTGIVIDPISFRVIEGLIGSPKTPPTPSPAALVAATVLDDSERGLGAIAAAFGAEECRVWVRDAAELHNVEREGMLAPAAAKLAADSGLPVIVDDGRPSTWIAVWCARAAGDDAVGLLALRFAGVVPHRPSAELALVSVRIAVELSWLAIHRRIVAEQERLRAAAMIDTLTGAWTRAAFERTTEVELAAARRRGEEMTLVIFDIDGLHRVNEHHGHAAGDALLAHLGAVIRANVRVNDEVGRFGDDELAVLLMNADLERSRPVAEKLVRKILEAPLEIGGERVPFTVRAGVTGFDVGREKNGDAAFARAMRACEDAVAMPSRVGVCRISEVMPAVLSLDEDAQVGTPAGVTLAGGYRILHEINRGANGVVYRGEDLGLGRPVAIKVLRHDLGRDQALVEHFRREASILASMRHPNLVQVYAFGAADDVYFVMELVEGPTVADVVDDALARGEWLDAQAIAEVITEIADALDAMHAVGLIHCDVKPENILLDRHAGRAVLVDVGESKRHDEGRRRAGTPGYAAPESFAEGEETAAIDVYSLAATAYMMLSARLPFGVGDALSILARQLDAPPPPPSTIRSGLTAAVDVVIAKAMSVEPGNRFMTPGGFAAALRMALRGTDETAAPPERAETAGQLRELTVDEVAAFALPEAETAQVRGAAFRVAAKVLAARVGEPWLRRVAEVRRDLAEVLQPTIPPMSWQPLARLIDLVAATTSELDEPEVLRTIGRGMVSVTFGHLYGADPRGMSTHGLLESVPQLWSRYFGAGSVALLGASDERVVLQLEGWDENADGLVAGFLERIAELTGAAVVTVSWSRNGASTIFTVEWSHDGSSSPE